MAVPATTWWVSFKQNVKSMVLEPKEPRAPRTSSSTSFHSVVDENDETTRVPHETATGILELPMNIMLAIMLLWLPRFFIPWIAVWHEYTAHFLIEPDQIKANNREIFNQDNILFCGKCAITMFTSFIAGVLDMERSAYLIMLILYLSCPVVGGYVDNVLRIRLVDSDLYRHWYMATALMHWTMAIPFIFFPVQLTAIFYEKQNMSRQAHYNWVGFFSFFEFLNEYIAFWVIPGECPTTEWLHFVVWVEIGLAMYTAVLLTIIFFFAARALTNELMNCFNSCTLTKEDVLGPDGSWSAAMKMAACYLCIFIPVIYASFVFAVLQRFVPDVDWDESLSATSMFYVGRIIGVVVMIIVSTFVRKYGRKLSRIRLFRSDVLVLGLPHIFITTALLVFCSRFAMMSHSKEGEVIMGPIPDHTKTVLIFLNLIFRNRTVCVSSEHFHPMKIRPFRHAIREMSNAGIDSISFTVTPDPDSIPSIAAEHEIGNLSEGEWAAISISLVNYLAPEDGETKLKNYYTRPRVTTQRVNQTHPEKIPQVILLNMDHINTEESREVIYSLKRERLSHPTDDPDFRVTAREDGNAQILELRPGNWSIRIETVNESDAVGPWFDFNIDSSYSVYCLANYLNRPVKSNGTWSSVAFHHSVQFELFKISEAAGPEISYKPSRQQLQVDAAIQTGITFTGMAAGGVYVGVIFMFWTESFISTTMRFSILWVLMAAVKEAPQIKLVDVDWVVSTALCSLQIVFTILHFIGATFLYRPEFNAQIRPD